MRRWHRRFQGWLWILLLIALLPGFARAGTISGRVIEDPGEAPIVGLDVIACLYSDNSGCRSATTDGSGNFTIDSLAAGDYRVYADTWGTNFVAEYYDDTTDWNTASRVVVTAEGNTGNIDMALAYGFDHDVSVMNIHQPDGRFQTYYSFYPGGFTGNPAVDISSVTVLTPVSHTPFPLVWDPVWNEYALVIDGSPEAGVHVFTATMADGHVVVSTDYQYVIQTLPSPDTASSSPAEGTVVASKTPIFTWAPVDLPGVPIYYRFEVVDNLTDERVWASSRAFSMTSITLPEGLLGPGSYRWRVRVADSGDWVAVQNRTNGDWINFTVPAALDAHDALPAVDPNNWNGLSWIGGNAFACSVRVVDLDGVAHDGSSHTLRVIAPSGATFPDGSSERFAGFDGADGPTAGYFWLYIEGLPTPGNYTFIVTDLEGNEASFVETVDVSPINGPDETTLRPSNIDETLTATFDNVYVNGESYETFDLTDISELAPDKWRWASEATIVDGQLRVDIRNFIGRANGGVNFSQAQPITSVQADVTVTSMSGSSVTKGARISGTFFNGGSNSDYWVIMWNDGSNVYYTVDRDWINQQGTNQWETVQRENIVPAAVGDVVTMGVAWDEGTKTLTFTANNQTQGVSGVRQYVHPGPVYPPISKELSLQGRINLVTSTTPTFSWDPVPGANRYRFRIYTADNSKTVWRGYTGSETSYTVPPGVLAPDAYYRYRVEAWDAPSPLSVDNYSRAPISSGEHYRFYTDSTIPQAPHIDLDGSGAHTIQSDASGVFPAFWVRVNDLQGVPGNIASVKVSYPGGHEEFLYLDHTDGPYCGYYNTVSEEPAVDGTYTFTVTDRDGNSAIITDDLDYNPIAYPAAGSLLATVGSEAVQISWEPVAAAAFYRLEIYNEAYERTHRLTVDPAEFAPGEHPSIAVPRGLLEEGHLYRYRVRTYREFYSEISGVDAEGNFDNCLQIPFAPSQYPTFFLSPASGTSDPIIELDNRGVFVSHAWDPLLKQDAYFLEFQVKVTDLDGVPGNIDRVYATLPNASTVDLVHDERISDTEAYYYAYKRFDNIADITALEGDFTFTVSDYDSHSATTPADNLSDVATNMLAVPSYLSPLPDVMLYSTTPTISWAPVAGADSYRVRLFTSWHSTLSWSDYIATTFWKVPYGLLAPGTTYAYRVYANRGGFPSADLDFTSFSLLYYSWSPHFSISPTPDTDADGILDAVEDGHACLDPEDADSDNDGLLDGIEDADRDGFVDDGETHPCVWDTDEDGMGDGYEVHYALDPLVDDADDDPDDDLFTNYMESLCGSHPRNIYDYPSLGSGFDDDMDVDGLDLYHAADGFDRGLFDPDDIKDFAGGYGR